MKINKQKYDVMFEAMKAVVNHYGIPAIKRAAAVKFSSERIVWDLWCIASDNLMYNDGDYRFKYGISPRIIPYNKDFDPYSDDVNDDHIETALLKIGKKLEVI